VYTESNIWSRWILWTQIFQTTSWLQKYWHGYRKCCIQWKK